MAGYGPKLVREWLDGLDRKLAADAARASTGSHPGMIGDEREKVFADALREFLPPSLHIGSGKVIASGGPPSKQIDVVVFDSRFPVFRQGDNALYPIEGVIATIEVKSMLSEAELHGALENCRSVMELDLVLVKEDTERAIARHVSGGMSPEEAWERLVWDLLPRTYVFGYDGVKELGTLDRTIADWLRKGGPGTRNRPYMPSVIVTGGAVAIAWGDPIRVHPSDADTPRPRDEDIVFFSFKTESRFGILASHLLWHIERRMTLFEHAAPIRRVFNVYIPFAEYIDAIVRDGGYTLSTWTNREMTRRTRDAE